MDKKAVDAFAKIHFIERYRRMSDHYHFELKESFEAYDSAEVLRIIQELGYKASFNKKEKFFKIIEIVNVYKFQFVISLTYGAAEWIWSVWEHGELKVGATWGMLKQELDGREDEKVRKPIFRNYEELKLLLTEAFIIYEDFKEAYKQT